MNSSMIPSPHAHDQTWTPGIPAETLSEADRKRLFAGLTGKQQAWVVAYLSNGLNATAASRQAGYKASDRRTHSNIGYRNRQHPVIAQLVADAFQGQVMTANEALARVAALARGSMDDFIVIDDGGRARIDMQRAAACGAMPLVKQLDVDEDEYVDGEGRTHTRTRTRLRLHDSLKALDMVLKATGAYQPHEDASSAVNNFFGAINQQLVQSASSKAT